LVGKANKVGKYIPIRVCDVARVARSSIRGISQIWLQIQEGSRKSFGLKICPKKMPIVNNVGWFFMEKLKR